MAVLVTVLLVAGCGRSERLSDAKLTRVFQSHASAFDDAVSMLLEEPSLRLVGSDRIDHWRRGEDGLWRDVRQGHQSSTATLEQVLADVALDRSRFDKYVSFLQTVDAKFIEVYRENRIVQSADFVFGINGMVLTDSTMTSITWIWGHHRFRTIDTDTSIANEETLVRPLTERWYIKREDS